eukprot:jgi/Tetstr1/423682/TSEL_014316.t1
MANDKENVQPLVRTPENVATASPLAAKSDSVVAQHRDWLDRIRSHTGSDPLAIWDRYLLWVKDADPPAYRTALRSCVQETALLEQYHSDARYLRVWVKYADCHSLAEQGEVLREMEAKRIGEEHALLYLAHATFLERMHDFAGARAVYEKGMRRAAEPVSKLEWNFEKFQERMASRERRSHKQAAKAQGKRKKQATPYKAASGNSALRVLPDVPPPAQTDKRLRQTEDAPAYSRRRPEMPGYLPALLAGEDGVPSSFEEGRAMAWFAARRAHVPKHSMGPTTAPSATSTPLLLDISPLHGVAVASGLPSEAVDATPSITINTRAAMEEINGMFAEALPGDDEAPEPTLTLATRAAIGAIDDMFLQELPHEAANTPRALQTPISEAGMDVEGHQQEAEEEEQGQEEDKENMGRPRTGASVCGGATSDADDRALQELTSAFAKGAVGQEAGDATAVLLVVTDAQPDSFAVLADGEQAPPSADSVSPVPATARETIDPHEAGLRERLLQALNPQIEQWPGYCSMEEEEAEAALEVLASKHCANEFIELGGEAVDQVEKDGEDTLAALKVERPPSAWEFYIARTLADRLQDRPGAMPRFAEAQALHVAGGEASLLLTGLGIFGTLQDLVNAYRIKGQTMPEPVVKFYTHELLLAARDLHCSHVIHCDIKPDNLLIRHPRSWADWDASQPATWGDAGLQLIDYGRAVDLQLLPAGVVFHADCGPGCFRCIEMQEGRPWTYQVDCYGIASVVHFMLFGEYIQVQRLTEPVSGQRSYRLKAAFKRYWDCDLWEALFNQLLNWTPLDEVPPWGSLIEQVQTCWQSNTEVGKALQTHLRKQAIMLHQDD